jgi:DNA polymerase III epsilon subunit-like protein
MAYVVFDTETTGLPSTRARTVSLKTLASWDTCRVVSFAMVVYNSDHTENSNYHAIIKPDGYTVGATEIHGITDEVANESGVDFLEAYYMFAHIFSVCEMVVGHNVSFDINVLESECLRRGLVLPSFKSACTLKMARTMFMEPINKLCVLYKKFFGEELDGAHDALVDARASGRLYAFMIIDPRRHSSIPTKRVILKASEIAACIGQSNFKKPHNVMCDLWKKYSPDTFTGKTVIDIQEEAISNSSESQTVLAIVDSLIPKDSSEAHKVFLAAKACIDADTSLSRGDKVHITDHIRSKVYTSHGIRTEDKTADLDSRNLQTDNTFYSFPITTIAGTTYEIVGRIDRYYVDEMGDKVLIEIKNRTKCIFNTVRDYENTQVQTYLAMTGMKRAQLIEQFNDERVVHDIEIDGEWDETVSSLTEFCKTLHHNMSLK